MLQWVAAFVAVLAMLASAALDGAAIFRATGHAAALDLAAASIAASEAQYGCYTQVLNAALPSFFVARGMAADRVQILVSNPDQPAANGQSVFAQVNYTSYVRVLLPFGASFTEPETFSRSAVDISEYAPGGPAPPCTPPAGFGG
ncbi:MAG: hypothetical protein M0Z27_06985 [Thermaerobacter sp.]|nr:hypothetical protein [Thermaerobacter sp.]